MGRKFIDAFRDEPFGIILTTISALAAAAVIAIFSVDQIQTHIKAKEVRTMIEYQLSESIKKSKIDQKDLKELQKSVMAFSDEAKAFKYKFKSNDSASAGDYNLLDNLINLRGYLNNMNRFGIDTTSYVKEVDILSMQLKEELLKRAKQLE